MMVWDCSQGGLLEVIYMKSVTLSLQKTLLGQTVLAFVHIDKSIFLEILGKFEMG